MQLFRAGVYVPAGEIAVWFSEEKGVSRLFLPGREPAEKPPAGALPWSGLASDLESYFRGEGRKTAFPYPLDMTGYTDFIRSVLELVRRIPPGETRTYREMARQAGVPGGARAAGRALAANRTPLLVPCHRVVRSDGGIGGFSSGLPWKRYLLALESGGNRLQPPAT